MFQIPIDFKTNTPQQTFEVGRIFGQMVINQIDEAVVISLQGGIAEGKSHFNHGLASAFFSNLPLSSFRNTFFHQTTASGRDVICYDTINARPDLDSIFEKKSNPIISAEHIYTHPLVKLVHWRNRFPVKKYPPNFNVKLSTLRMNL